MTKKVPYSGIEFGYQNIANEIQYMRVITKKFLSPECDGVLQQCVEDLDSIRNSSADRTQYWGIKDNLPLKTVESNGEYRNTSKGTGRSVFATLSFRWGIRNPSSKNSKTFCLVDEATTSIQIFDSESQKLVALWQTEIGDATSPGCHFHSSMTERNYKSTEKLYNHSQSGDIAPTSESAALFPEWLKVPRMPSVLVTPMDGLEFLLGELFQVRWSQSISQDSHNLSSWAKCQGDRLKRLLKWKLEEVGKADTTPWMALKRAKPDRNIFIGNQ
jgi:hypothetical protein